MHTHLQSPIHPLGVLDFGICQEGISLVAQLEKQRKSEIDNFMGQFYGHIMPHMNVIMRVKRPMTAIFVFLVFAGQR